MVKNRISMEQVQLDRRHFLKAAALGAAMVVMGTTGCASTGRGSAGSSLAGAASSEAGSSAAAGSASELSSAEAQASDQAQTPESAEPAAGKELVLVFSRADENYKVGYVEVGNTMVLAQFVQQKRGADLFELQPVRPYAADYQTCIDYVLEEQKRAGRPQLKELPDLTNYDTIFFGFPVWWGDIPMPVYTAIESLDRNGKTIVPFNTHEGSGDAGMFSTLARVCAGATVLKGLTVAGTVAQNQRDTAEQHVDEWLAGLAL